MNKEETGIEGLALLTPHRYSDERGFFEETYQKKAYEACGIDAEFVQDNQSFSKKGVLRGLHYQREPFAQAKLVRCIEGRIFDVAVDIRKDSATYGAWFGTELSRENGKQLYLPKGFLHGFLALTDAIMAYKVDAYYHQASDGAIRFDDPAIGIDWPSVNIDYLLSEKDANAPLLHEAAL
jgi:dTDP-4-dehydrorhamnose 3,5-epimerase